MDLYILRHAIAVARGTPGFENDRLRPLTPKGKKKMERIAQGMKSLKMPLDFILSSPYLRAKQTAEIASRALSAGKKLKIEPKLSADARPESLIDELKKKYPGADGLLLVGHEPFLSRLISLLLAGSESMEVRLKKGGLCKLSAQPLRPGKCAALEWLLAPKQLIKL